MAHAGAGRLEHDLDREMRGAVEPARRIDDLARPLLGVVDQLLKFFQGWLALTNSIEGSAETSAIGANCSRVKLGGRPNT